MSETQGKRIRTKIADEDTDHRGAARPIPVGTLGTVGELDAGSGLYAIHWDNGGWTRWTAEELARDAEDVVVVDAATLLLLMQVAEDARGFIECNCGGPCDGNCTHSMATRALARDGARLTSPVPVPVRQPAATGAMTTRRLSDNRRLKALRTLAGKLAYSDVSTRLEDKALAEAISDLCVEGKADLDIQDCAECGHRLYLHRRHASGAYRCTSSGCGCELAAVEPAHTR